MSALSPAGIAALREAMTAHVDAGKLPGLVTLVARGDDVHVDAVGHAAFGDTKPLGRDAIFRIASLSKPVTAATAMTLIEQGTLRLDQPIDDLVPELANRRVLRTIASELDDTVPARRSITIEDLLTFRLGFGTLMAMPGTYPIQAAEVAAGLQSIGGPPWPPVAHDADSWIGALGALPLMAQPGERWLYNTGAQVLGVVLARATGTPLPELMRERILEPLGMVDTGFTVPANARDRLTTFYAPDPVTEALSTIDTPAESWWSTDPGFPDASGMLVSTIDDYWRFASMMIGGGALDGTRVLTDDSAAQMTTDRLTPENRAGDHCFLPPHAGWGLGMETPRAGTDTEPLPCGFGWDGGSGTSWRTGRGHDVTGILFTQRAMTSPAPPVIFHDFWAGVNAALAGG